VIFADLAVVEKQAQPVVVEIAESAGETRLVLLIFKFSDSVWPLESSACAK
jgi:hypothetical protein